jgi:hypothetical protein
VNHLPEASERAMSARKTSSWTAVRVWSYLEGSAKEIRAPRSMGELYLWKTGRPSARTWFVVRSNVTSSAEAIDWTGFPEEEAMEIAGSVLLDRVERPKQRWPSILARPPRKSHIDVLRRAAQDPEGVVRERLHGARAAALQERGLIEDATVAGERVKRITPRGRELLRELDTRR